MSVPCVCSSLNLSGMKWFTRIDQGHLFSTPNTLIIEFDFAYSVYSSTSVVPGADDSSPEICTEFGSGRPGRQFGSLAVQVCRSLPHKQPTCQHWWRADILVPGAAVEVPELRLRLIKLNPTSKPNLLKHKDRTRQDTTNNTRNGWMQPADRIMYVQSSPYSVATPYLTFIPHWPGPFWWISTPTSTPTNKSHETLWSSVLDRHKPTLTNRFRHLVCVTSPESGSWPCRSLVLLN